MQLPPAHASRFCPILVSGVIPSITQSCPCRFRRKGVYMGRFLPLRSTVSLVMATLLAAPFTAFADKNKEKDPDAIGDRDVSGKVNFYSLEREIALGKSYAQQVERQSKIINDPVIAEYVNRIGQNLVRNSD